MATLQPYAPTAAKPWNLDRVLHFYRRAGYGCTLAQAQAALQKSPTDLVDELFDTAADLGAPDPPYWAGWTNVDYDNDPDEDLYFKHQDQLARRWLGEMLSEGVRARMAFFWHNHFVTELEVVGCNSYFWDYFSLVHEFAFGNFRVFAREMGKNAAMLVYLNGNQNIADEPNENYARELLELFTMGENNGYSQVDIVEMARALTGWQAAMYECTPAFYDASLHDTQNKTIFGKTANYNFNQAHNLIFTERAEQVSHFICEKLYKFFVYAKPDAAIVEELATTFRNSNWEILPVVKQLLKSEHFFEQSFISCQIRSPLDSMLPIWAAAGAKYPDHIEDGQMDAARYYSYTLGQEIFNPPNVAGWKGYRSWINESTLTGRWQTSSSIVYYIQENETLRENLRALAQNLTSNSNNPALITEQLVHFFTGQKLDPTQQFAATGAFKSGIPQNYFDDGSWNLDWDEAPYQCTNLLYFLVRMPEFQLS